MGQSGPTYDDWGHCYWVDLEEEIAGMDLRTYNLPPGCFSIPPEIHALTFHDGLWKNLNARLGLLLDIAEEEEVPPTKVSYMAMLVREHCDRNYRGKLGELRFVAGRQVAPFPADICVTLSAETAVRWLDALAAYLEESAEMRKTVVINL